MCAHFPPRSLIIIFSCGFAFFLKKYYSRLSTIFFSTNHTQRIDKVPKIVPTIRKAGNGRDDDVKPRIDSARRHQTSNVLFPSYRSGFSSVPIFPQPTAAAAERLTCRQCIDIASLFPPSTLLIDWLLFFFHFRRAKRIL